MVYASRTHQLMGFEAKNSVSEALPSDASSVQLTHYEHIATGNSCLKIGKSSNK